MVAHLAYSVCFEFVANALHCLALLAITESIGFLETKANVYFILLFKYTVGA